MQKVTVGFLGCGNIGSGVWKLISDFRYEFAHRHQLEITVKKILVRDVTKPRGFSLPEGVLTDRAEDVLEDSEIQIVMEFLGGEYPATSYILQALHNGKTVVTANKVALALHWHELQAEAVRQQVGLYYEASVCGAIPVIDVLQHSLGANRIDKLYGIINGTTNYILSRMAETGLPYEQVLQEAQQLGLAEPDPASDVEGLDAAYKLSIMASLAFHGRVTFPKVYREGITRVTDQDIAFGREMGLVLKLLAIAKRTGNQVEVRVHPTFLPKSHPLARVDGSFNAVYLHGHACQEMMLQGRGAGDMPTASALVSDLIRAATASVHQHPTFRNTEQPDPSLDFSQNWVTRYYLRLSCSDSVGVLARVSDCFAKENISIATMVQKDTGMPGRVTIVLTTHAAPELALQHAIHALDTQICRVESVIRVEE